MLLVLRIVLGFGLFCSWGIAWVTHEKKVQNATQSTAVIMFVYGVLCLSLLLTITEVN